MADGTFTEIVADDGKINYQSETSNGAITIFTTYDADLMS